MQNRYVGDVGDFGKFGLLRALINRESNDSTLRLSIVWCLYPDESHNSDGKHVAYLNRDDMRALDPIVFDRLRAIVNSDRRRISEISDSTLFKRPETVFVDALAVASRADGRMAPPSERVAYRRDWVEHCLDRSKNCDLVFFDPDNGIASEKMNRKDPKAGKFVFLEELRPFAERGQSLIVYHHADRTRTDVLVDRIKVRLRDHIPNSTEIFPLIYHRGSCRIFFVLAAEPHQEQIKTRIDEFLASGWNRHFDVG